MKIVYNLFLLVDPEDPHWKAGGYRILPQSQDERRKGLAATTFMFHGRLGLFQIPVPEQITYLY